VAKKLCKWTGGKTTHIEMEDLAEKTLEVRLRRAELLVEGKGAQE